MNTTNINIKQIRDLRDKAFVKECIKRFNTIHLANESITDIDTFLKDVIHHPAPTFYINYDTAYSKIRPIIGKGSLSKSKATTLTQMQYHDLAKMVAQAMEKRKSRTITTALAQVLVREKAPRFYITLEHARRLTRNLFVRSMSYRLKKEFEAAI
ncbi:MAG: hypothetical protein ACI30K_03955 [Muribaculaceae bacterium]